MNVKRIEIDENMVNNIQLKDCKVHAMQAIVNNFLETHLLDTSLEAINSPIFIAFNQQLVEAKVDFERSKDEMIHTYFQEKDKQNLVNWQLDYFDNILTCVINE